MSETLTKLDNSCKTVRASAQIVFRGHSRSIMIGNNSFVEIKPVASYPSQFERQEWREYQLSITSQYKSRNGKSVSGTSSHGLPGKDPSNGCIHFKY